MPPRQPAPPRWLLIAVLGALSAFVPFALDLYLPVLPELTAGLAASDAQGQLTVSMCMIGLALGQVLGGPISDRRGRRAPVLVGVAVFVVASVLCAVAPTIEVLLALRLLQGIAGAAGVVVARAVVRDLYASREAARMFSVLAVVGGVAPIVAPTIGGALAIVMDWRGIFLVLAGIGFAILVAAWLVLPDTLSPESRHRGGLGAQVRDAGALVRNRTFLGYVLANAFIGTTLFAYISMSSLVLQRDYGVSAELFAALYALNAVGIVVGSQANVFLVRRIDPRRLLVTATAVSVVATAIGVGVTAAGLGIAPLMATLFVTALSQGLTWPNSTALALTPVVRGVGSAAAILGVVQYVVAAVVPPLAALGGASGVAMLATMCGCGVVGLVLLFTLARPQRVHGVDTTSG